MGPPGLPIITKIVHIPVVIAGTRGKIVLETAKMRRETYKPLYCKCSGARTKDIYGAECERKIEETSGKMLREPNL